MNEGSTFNEDSTITADLGIGSENVFRPTQALKNIKNIFNFIGPAFIVSVAYIDPGNFATNISGGSIF